MRSFLGVSLIIAALAGPAIATAQETRAPTEAPIKYDEWEQFPPAWEKALRTLGDDTLYLLSSPLRLSPESALVLAGVGAGSQGSRSRTGPFETPSLHTATTVYVTPPMMLPFSVMQAFSWA